jgi:hypothetical protein
VGVEPHPAHTDHHGRDRHHVDQGLAGGAAGQVADGGLRLHADKEEQRAAEHGRGQRPEARHLLARRGTGHARRRLAHQQATDDDGEHPRGVHEVGQQKGGEGGDQHGDVLQRGVLDPPSHRRAEQPDQPTREHSPAVGKGQEPRDRPDAQLLLAHRDPDRDRVDHQGGAVVDEALGPQHGHGPAGQGSGQHADGRGVGRRDGRAEHPRRAPRHPEQEVRDRRHRRGTGHHQDRAGEDDNPQVAADLAQGGREALPVEQGGQEHQQHDLRRQLHLAQRRHEPEHHADRQQGDRRRDGELLGQGAAHQQRDTHDDDHLQTEHDALLLPGHSGV